MSLLLGNKTYLKMTRTNPGYHIVAWNLTNAELAVCFFEF